MTTFGQLAAGAEFHLQGGRITYRKESEGRQEAIVAHDPEARTTGTTTRFGFEKPVQLGRPDLTAEK